MIARCLVGVAVTRRVRRITRGELSRWKVGIGRGDPLFEFFHFELNDRFLVHRMTPVSIAAYRIVHVVEDSQISLCSLVMMLGIRLRGRTCRDVVTSTAFGTGVIGVVLTGIVVPGIPDDAGSDALFQLFDIEG
jgi:hypothetical protein